LANFKLQPLKSRKICSAVQWLVRTSDENSTWV